MMSVLSGITNKWKILIRSDDIMWFKDDITNIFKEEFVWTTHYQKWTWFPGHTLYISGIVNTETTFYSGCPNAEISCE